MPRICFNRRARTIACLLLAVAGLTALCVVVTPTPRPVRAEPPPCGESGCSRYGIRRLKRSRPTK